MDNTILLLFAAIVVVGIALLVIIALSRRPSGRLDTAKYQERWLKIMSGVSDDTASLHMAVLSADTLLDTALKERGIKGNTMGERLKQSGSVFRNLNGVWTAHKLRNRIAHEPDTKLDARQVRQALDIFKAALKDLGAL